MNRRPFVSFALATPAPTAQPQPLQPIGSIEDRVHRIVSEHMGIPLQQIQPPSRFITDLKADSLDLVELVMAFEDEFGVEMSERDCAGLATVGQVVAWLQQHTAAKQTT